MKRSVDSRSLRPEDGDELNDDMRPATPSAAVMRESEIKRFVVKLQFACMQRNGYGD